MNTLEQHYRDLCDIEFTVERGKLWMLQTRVGKRTAGAAFRIATQLVDEGLIDMDEAVRRVSGPQLAQLMFPQFDRSHSQAPATKGTAASPGAAVGQVVFNSEDAVVAAAEGRDVILVRRETNPDDLPGMVAAAGILTTRGGKTSHAAVVARGMGKTAVCGTESIEIDTVAHTMLMPDGSMLREGDVISIDGTTGEVFSGPVDVRPSPVVEYFDAGIDAALDSADEHTAELVQAVDRIMRHADEARRLRVRANADTPEDAARGRRMGSQGIGLCRTEHMFLGDRKQYVEKLILADTDEDREAALAALLPLQRKDFIRILEVMDGLPVTIRLIDPPLHEFLPDLTELSVRVAVAEEQGTPNEADLRLLRAVRRLHESNPMLGLRGVRLGLVVPGLFALQVRAIAEAACFRQRLGGDPRAEIMIPLVGSVHELELVTDEAAGVLADVASKHGCTLRFPIGTMIELPRAALTAGEIAKSAEFFSFGTNDLTQTTWGFSRDDVEAGFFSLYLDKGVFGVSPFESIDVEGVGPAGEDRRRRGPQGPARHAPRCVWRARRGPAVGALLPRRGPGLRVLLAVPRAGGTAGGGAGLAGHDQLRHAVGRTPHSAQRSSTVSRLTTVDDLQMMFENGQYEALIPALRERMSEDPATLTDPFVKQWVGIRWRDLFLKAAMTDEHAIAETKKLPRSAAASAGERQFQPGCASGAGQPFPQGSEPDRSRDRPAACAVRRDPEHVDGPGTWNVDRPAAPRGARLPDRSRRAAGRTGVAVLPL